MTPLRIFIGYDPTEPVAYHVLSHSLLSRSRQPISITPLVQNALRTQGLYTRLRGPTESTEFSLTRFLVPYLSGYKGISIFMDCDILCRTDIATLLPFVDDSHPVWACQHVYTPKYDTKFRGQAQVAYAKKNWSSVMVFNNTLCEKLSPKYVNTASGLDLHQFNWASSVGALPLPWNWLVGEYPPNDDAFLFHYTNGGPWFRDYQYCDHAQAWFDELDLAFPSLNIPKPVEG